MNVKTTWERYSRTREQTDRDALITHYMGLVEKISGYVGSSLPSNVEQDDLTSSGYFGLIDAVERFDPSKGFKFETFASPRIRGAMLDHLRGADWAPRSLRARVREIKRKREELTSRLHREPRDEEIAKALGWDTEQVVDVNSKSVISHTWSLDIEDDSGEGGDSGGTFVDIMTTGETADSSFDFEDLMISLEVAINELLPKERIVFTLFYYEGASLAEIGKIFNVTESRVCQILTQAALNCRSRLDLTH